MSELEDRLAIRELADRYADAITRGDWEQHASVFCEDAVWEVAAPFGFRAVGRTAIRDFVRDACAGMEFLLQLNGATVIHSLSGERASATTTLQEIGRRVGGAGHLLNLGIYYDELEKRDGRWRYRHRRFQPIYVDPSALTGTAAIARAALSALRPGGGS